MGWTHPSKWLLGFEQIRTDGNRREKIRRNSLSWGHIIWTLVQIIHRKNVQHAKYYSRRPVLNNIIIKRQTYSIPQERSLWDIGNGSQQFFVDTVSIFTRWKLYKLPRDPSCEQKQKDSTLIKLRK